MRKRDVELGGLYLAKVSNRLVPVRVKSESRFGGWDAVNQKTGRDVRIKSAQRLRRRLDAGKTTAANAGGNDVRGDAALPDAVDHAQPQHDGQKGEETMAKKESKKRGGNVAKKSRKPAVKKTAAEAEKHRGACPACGRVVELPNHKGRCECGQALFARGGRLARIKETPAGCVEMDAATTISEPPVVVPGKPVRKRADGKMGGLDAAAQVLADAGEPLDTKTMVERMLDKGLWQTKGKTPAATIYAAIIREIAKKGDASRFRKTDRGKFTLAK